LTHWADADEVSTVINKASVVSIVFMQFHSSMSAALSFDCTAQRQPFPIVPPDFLGSMTATCGQESSRNCAAASLEVKVKILGGLPHFTQPWQPTGTQRSCTGRTTG
jgi:hypothetical protein